jgi:aryl-alcohol dehydrogenase-like predicted oxidoreductase
MAHMRQRQLGHAGPLVGSIGLGCMGLSAVYAPGSIAFDVGVAVIRRAVEVGVTLLDTSDAYGPHTNERLVGEAIRPVRAEVIVATKAGCAPNLESFVPRPDGRPDTLRRCCDESLQRLGIDVIDLWQLHRVDPDVPIEESVGAMSDMVRAGKVRYLGVSEVTLGELRRAHTTWPIATLQSELSLWTRHLLDELVPPLNGLSRNR